MAALRQQVQVFVAQEKARIEAIDCRQSQTGVCEPLKDIRFSQGQVVNAKLRPDQTILLADSGLAHPSVLRYRSRVLAFYRLNEASGRFEASDPLIPETPRWGAELLRAIDGFQYRYTDAAGAPAQRPVFVPAPWLAELRPLLREHRDFASAYRAQHGLPVLGHLAEHNPEAGFVMVDQIFGPFLKAHRTAFCAKDAQGLEQAADRMAGSLRELMQSHGVDYVNLSAGADRESLAEAWTQQKCEGSASAAELDRLVLAFRPVYGALFESPGVLGVQAAGVLMSPQSHGLDVLALRNRVRVSSFQADRTALPADGVTGGQRPLVREDLAQDRSWVDVFVNGGQIGLDFPPEHGSSPPLYANGLYSMSMGPLSSASTSYSAPLVLSRLIQLKQRRAPDAALDDALIQRLRQDLTPSGCSWAPEDAGVCKLQDPSWHRQQRLFEQGWLPKDWRWQGQAVETGGQGPGRRG